MQLTLVRLTLMKCIICMLNINKLVIQSWI